LEFRGIMDDDDLRFSDLEENSDGDNDDDAAAAGGVNLGLNQTGEEDGEKADKVKGLRHLKEMSGLLGLDKFKARAESKRQRKRRARERKRAVASTTPTADRASRMVQTAASRRLGLDKAEVEVVEHKDTRKKGNKRKREEQEADDQEAVAAVELSMKQARFDVFKLGVSGMEKEKQQDAETAMLVRLGAKPPKSQRVDYPELKAARKEEKEKERERKALERLSGVRGVFGSRGKTLQNPQKAKGGQGSKKGKRNKGGGGDGLQAKVGSFDGGMLKLSAKDLMKIKGSAKKFK
jgi:hypothetical protein